MSELDTSEWKDASRRYLRLRRLWWRCWFGGIALFAVLGTPLFVFKQMNPLLQGAIGTVLGVGFLGCWVGCVVAWFGLVTLRCPRCGGRVMMSWWSSWPTNRCKHCGLYLGPSVAGPG